MVYTKDQEKIILAGFLKWKKPTEIAEMINSFGLGDLNAFDIHNFIQKNEKRWQNMQPYCACCNHPIKTHPRCPHCTKLLHGDEKCCTL